MYISKILKCHSRIIGLAHITYKYIFINLVPKFPKYDNYK